MTRFWALVTSAAVFAVLLGACGNSEASSDGAGPRSFYLEAEVSVTDRSSTIGTNLPAPDTVTTTTTSIRWWSRDVTHARWEMGGYVGVLDGERFWSYDTSANTYTAAEVPPLPRGYVAYNLPMTLLLGPTNTRDLDAFIADLKTRAESVERVGSDTVLGRDVTIVEARPASRSTSQEAGRPAVDESHGSIRYWVDEERLFVVRVELADDVQSAIAVVTKLDYAVDIPDKAVAFEPLAGATKVEP